MRFLQTILLATLSVTTVDAFWGSKCKKPKSTPAEYGIMTNYLKAFEGKINWAKENAEFIVTE
jgi:hypothetical protein